MAQGYDNWQTILIRANADKDGTPKTQKWADLKGTIIDAQGKKWYVDLWEHQGKYGTFYSGRWDKEATEQPRGGQRPAYTRPQGIPDPRGPAQRPDPGQEMVSAQNPNTGVWGRLPRATAEQLGFHIAADNPNGPPDREVPF